MTYHKFGHGENAFGSFEVFVGDGRKLYEKDDWPIEGNFILEEGKFFWWACVAGCLPDTEPFGPFGSEKEAIEDANSYWDEGSKY